MEDGEGALLHLPGPPAEDDPLLEARRHRTPREEEQARADLGPMRKLVVVLTTGREVSNLAILTRVTVGSI